MKVTDIFSPRVFLCKAGRFLQNIHSKHINAEGDFDYAPERDTFGSDGFMESCDPKDFEEKTRNEDNYITDDYSDSEDSGSGNDYVSDSEGNGPGNENIQADPVSGPGVGAEIVEIRSEPETRSINHMPILVFEGTLDKIHLPIYYFIVSWVDCKL